mmetsp:Transcript_9182/g.21465  ORF Transcript_9182/g.21465 Transcript_9182/m.21465 type:complete len:84 (-) Transcript_9182:1598-1849(-)
MTRTLMSTAASCNNAIYGMMMRFASTSMSTQLDGRRSQRHAGSEKHMAGKDHGWKRRMPRLEALVAKVLPKGATVRGGGLLTK